MEEQTGRSLTDEEKAFLAEALYVWRYIGHVLNTNNQVPQVSVDRRDAALRIAKALGVRDEWLDLIFHHPILTVTVREFDEWNETKMYTDSLGAGGHRKSKPDPPRTKRRGPIGKSPNKLKKRPNKS